MIRRLINWLLFREPRRALLRERRRAPWLTDEELAKAEREEAKAGGPLDEETRYGAEDAVNRDLRLPPSWRCSCGGRPFVGHRCPRCGRDEAAGGTGRRSE